METIMWLAIALIIVVIGKWIGEYLWPEDWEDFNNRNN